MKTTIRTFAVAAALSLLPCALQGAPTQDGGTPARPTEEPEPYRLTPYSGTTVVEERVLGGVYLMFPELRASAEKPVILELWGLQVENGEPRPDASLSRATFVEKGRAFTYISYGDVEKYGTLFVSVVQDGKRSDVAVVQKSSAATSSSPLAATLQKVEGGNFVVYDCKLTAGCTVHVVTKNAEGNQEQKDYTLEKGETMHVSASLGAASWCSGCS